MRLTTGIVRHPGRTQPYTVWVQGRTVFFSDSEHEADAMLARELDRIKKAVSVWPHG